MSKTILFNNTARNKMKAGIDTAANAVKITLGPRGRNVAIESMTGHAPEITNDGRTILDNIFLKDRHENMGVELAKQTARKTDDLVEDGTTTTTVLYQAVINEGMKKIETNSPMLVRRGIEQAADMVVEELKLMAKPVTNLLEVALISSESEEMGRVVAETVEKVGPNGIVTFEESDDIGISSEIVDGMQIRKGFASPFMITRNDKFVAEYKDVHVLVTDRRILASEEFLSKMGTGLIPTLASSGIKDLVIIADDIDSEAMQTFILNKARQMFNILAIRAPGYGDMKRELLEDIASKVGATLVTEQSGVRFDKLDIASLGKARSVVSAQFTTTIAGGNVETTRERIDILSERLSVTEGKGDKKAIEERIAQLDGRVAIISYGANSDTQMKYLKKKLQDTVGAAKAALAEGVVQGGGAALVIAASRAKKRINKLEIDHEVYAGMEILFKAVRAPLMNIMENAGKEDDAFSTLSTVEAMGGYAGYDAAKEMIQEDMIASGVVDPVKVTRNALINAATDAALFLTTEVSMAEEVIEAKE